MANTIPSASVFYDGDGSTTQYPVTFEYLDKAYVFATVGGADAAFTWVTDNTIQFASAPAAGTQNVNIYRTTEADAMLAVFSEDTPFLPKYVDKDYTQLLHLVQEANSGSIDRDNTEAAAREAADASILATVTANYTKTLRTPDAVAQIPHTAAQRANKVPVFDSSGNPTVMVPASGSAADVLLQLASTAGSSMVGNAYGGTLQDSVQWRSITEWGVVPDSDADQTDLIQAAFNEIPAGWTLLVPKGVYRTKGGLTITKSFKLQGAGIGYWGVIQSPGYADTTTFVLTQDAEYLVKLGDCTNTTSSSDLSAYLVGFEANNIGFAGGQFTVSDSLVAIEHAFAPYFHRCVFDYVNGTAIRLQWVYEGLMTYCHVRRVDARYGAGLGVIVLDDKYAAIAGDNNVNHFKFLDGHIEHHWGDVVHLTPDSSVDYAQFSRNKFEMGRQNFDPSTAGTGDYLWSVFYLGRATRVDISHNHFANYGDYTGYRYFVTAGEDIGTGNIYGYASAYGEICNNHFANFGKIDKYGSGNSYIARIRGISSLEIHDNTNVDSYATSRDAAVLGLYDCTSQVPQRLEYLNNVGTVQYRSQSRAARRFTNGFISVHDLVTVTSKSFKYDSTARNIAKTVLVTSDALASVISIDADAFANFPAGVRIGVRCRSESGVGTIQFGSTNNTSSSYTVSSTYSTYYYSLSAADLAASSLAISIRTSGSNTENVYFDGIFVVPLSESVPGMQEAFYSGTLAANTGTATVSLPSTNNPSRNALYHVWTARGNAILSVYNGAMTVVHSNGDIAAATANPATAAKVNIYLDSSYNLVFSNLYTSSVAVRVFPLARY